MGKRAVKKRAKTIAAIDSETDPFEYGADIRPFLWGLYDGTMLPQFWGDDCTEKFVLWLEKEVLGGNEYILYAHNGGKFDFYFLIDYLDPDIFMINGRIAKASMFGGKVELRDSWLILPLPLSENDKDEIDYDTFKRGVRHLHRPKIEAYHRKDCESLYEWVNNFINEFGLHLTLPGSAFNFLRKKTSYEVKNTYERFDDTFRPYYFGGRVQCFDVGTFLGDHEYVDINSAYSKSMLSNHWHGGGMRIGTELPDTPNGSWFADITAISKGALPLRDRGKLLFPSDDTPRRYQAGGWEINAGIETGTLKILEVHRVLRPSSTRNFQEYVDYWFTKKFEAEQTSNKTQRQFAKLMLNACYGKFGQDGRKFQKFLLLEFGEFPTPEHDKSHWNQYKPYAETETGHSIFERPDPTTRFYNVATAASITSFVRAFLWRAIVSCDTPLYCDTDSIICKKFNGDIGTGIGQWSVEAKLIEIYIAQRKMYACLTDTGEWKTASKGVRLTAAQIKKGVISRENITFYKQSPAYSLKYGPRYFHREIDFENIVNNTVTIPE